MRRIREISRGSLTGQDVVSYDLFRRETEQSVALQRFPSEWMPISQMNGVHLSIPELPRVSPLRNVKNYEDFLTRLEAYPRDRPLHRLAGPGARLQDRRAQDQGAARRAEKALGTKFDIRKFHNALIDDGPLPWDVLEQRIEESDRGAALKATTLSRRTDRFGDWSKCVRRTLLDLMVKDSARAKPATFDCATDFALSIIAFDVRSS